MAALELKMIIKGVGEPGVAGDEKKTKKQFVVAHVPGYVDAFGEKKGRDEQWCLTILGDKVDALKADQSMVDKKAVIRFFINSFFVEENDARPSFYSVNCTIDSITIIP